MHRALLVCSLAVLVAAPVRGQEPIRGYAISADALADAADKAPAQRTRRDVLNVLPLVNSGSFVDFVASRMTLVDLLGTADALRLNKMVAAAPGIGGTGLVSRVAAPAVVGAAIEYGNILQQTTGTVTTLRGNLLGVARLAFGAEQFPQCVELTAGECRPLVRSLRRFSASVSFEQAAAAANVAGASPAPAALLSNDYRIAGWSARFDLTPSNNLDDPKYIAAWEKAMDSLQKSTTGADLTQAVVKAFGSGAAASAYTKWADQTVSLLMEASTAEFRPLLEKRLAVLVTALNEADPEFAANIRALSRAYSNYFEVRDTFIRAAQTHKFSLEYAEHRPTSEPQYSTVRMIYSDQPTSGPAIVTTNAALTFNKDEPRGSTRGDVRDVQLAAQIDRRLGDLTPLGAAVLTLGGYYQWIRDDAVIVIGPGTLAPGSGIEPPGAARTLLGTKGHVGVLQAKLSLPLGEAVKVPLSITWANRTELIKEKNVRGQIGFTLDVDQLFH